MKNLVDFIKESLNIDYLFEASFDKEDWKHRGGYEYITAVINDLFADKEVLLGNHGEGYKGISSLTIKDFNKDILDRILTDPSKYAHSDLNNALTSDMKQRFGRSNVWNAIYKAPYSGIVQKEKNYNIFEHTIAQNICSLIINGALDDNAKNADVTMKLWNKINNTPTIQKLQRMNLDMETIQSYVFVSGKGNTQRNKYNQIIDNNTFKVNITKQCELTKNTETTVENVLTQSGKIIADVTISLDGDNFNKSDLYHINSEDIYISCKDGSSQFSTISMQQPFYGFDSKTNNNSYIVNCYKEGKSFEQFNSNKDDICVVSFNNLCSLLSVDPKTIYDYFALPRDSRKRQNIKTLHKAEENDEVLAILIQLLVGGNYWYVNTSGDISYIDDNIDENKFTFIPSGTGYLEPTLIAVDGTMKTSDGNVKCTLIFRSSNGGNYPYRLFFKPKDNHIMAKLFT